MSEVAFALLALGTAGWTLHGLRFHFTRYDDVSAGTSKGSA